ncbi:MAG: secreted protein [Actinomycetia bacterium]|nr:secreted protein [Actinomycetes bacterium]
MRTVAFVVVTVVLSVLGVVRVGRWAIAETPDPLLVRAAPTTTTATPSTTTSTVPGFIDGPVVTGHRRAATTTTLSVAARSWTWDQLAACEAGGRWTATRGVYQGGLQFDARTWDRYVAAFPGFPADAQLASREQQIAVAEQVLAREGPKAWPTCGPRIGMTGTPIGAVEYPAGPPVEPD